MADNLSASIRRRSTISANRRTPGIGGVSVEQLQWPLLVVNFIGLLLVSATQLHPFMDESTRMAFDGEGGGLRQFCYFSMFAIIQLTGWKLSAPAKFWPVPLGISLLILWCTASISWSLAPEISIRRLILTVMIIWSIFQVVQAMGYALTIRILSYTLLALLFVNFLAVALVSNAIHHANPLGEMTLAGSWRGITPHKNVAGMLCAMTMCLFCFEARQFSRLLRLAVFLAAAYFMYRTQSKTSLGIVAVALGIGCMTLIYDVRLRLLVLPIVVLLGVAAALAFSFYFDPVMRTLASSQDAFSGRIQIWRVLVDYISEHPMLGTGFGAFWNIGSASPIYERASGAITNFPIGHQGYLDVAAQIGLPGLALTIFVLILLPIGYILSSPAMPRRAGAFLMAMLIFSMGHNFTESSFLERDSFLEMMLMMTIACVYAIIRGYGVPQEAEMDRDDGPSSFLARRAETLRSHDLRL